MEMGHNEAMLSALIALAVGSTWSATPAGDVWVYPNSSNPGGEAFLRMWGDGTLAIDTAMPPGDAYSYGYLQFSLKDLPKGELKKASLVVWNIPNEELTVDVLKEIPLEVYGMKGTFDEKKFAFDDKGIGPVAPMFGKSKAEVTKEGIKLDIDLNDEKGAFKKALEAARADGILNLALATKLSPQDSRGSIYKVNSKEGPEKLRPTLSLEFAD